MNGKQDVETGVLRNKSKLSTLDFRLLNVYLNFQFSTFGAKRHRACPTASFRRAKGTAPFN
jgi:hypothetical protein